VRHRGRLGKINADIARDSWVEEAYVSRLLSGEKHRPSRDALIRLGAFGLDLSVEGLDELLMAAEYLPIVSARSTDVAGPEQPEEVMAKKESTSTIMRLRGKIGAHTRWAKTEDRVAATEPARRALRSKFEREVDPEGLLPVQERLRRAESARKAHYARLALRSAQVRAKKRRG
jgi:hypothetical protein